MELTAFLTEHGVWIVEEDSVITSLNKQNLIVNSLDEVYGDRVVQLNEDQYNFWLAHRSENLTNRQIYNKVSKSKEELEADKLKEIEITRRKLYEENTDHLFLAYQKYLLLGNTNKAEEVKTLWLSKVKEIEENNPYITE